MRNRKYSEIRGTNMSRNIKRRKCMVPTKKDIHLFVANARNLPYTRNEIVYNKIDNIEAKLRPTVA